MTPTRRTLLWLGAMVFVALGSFGGGFWLAAHYIGEMSAGMHAYQNVDASLKHARAALTAIERDDPEHSRQVHDAQIRDAATTIGGYAASDSYFECSDRDRETIRAIDNYMATHATAKPDPGKWVSDQVETLCDAR